ncbi:MAG: hypothetical protein ACRDGQ_07460 [Candidatus Limnocylindrales bacterium]
MDQTVATLAIALGGAAVGVAVIAGGYLAAQAAIRDARASSRRADATPAPPVVDITGQERGTPGPVAGWPSGPTQASAPTGLRPLGRAVQGALKAGAETTRTAVSARREVRSPAAKSSGGVRKASSAKSTGPTQGTPTRTLSAAGRVVGLHRTRTILLGWLNVLEALAVGTTLNAATMRADLGDLRDCDLALLGDARLVGTYLSTAAKVGALSGQGMSPTIRQQVASLRVNVLTALAHQELRLMRGEEPVLVDSAGSVDFFDVGSRSVPLA